MKTYSQLFRIAPAFVLATMAVSTPARAVLPPGISDAFTVYDPAGAIFAQVTVSESDEDPNTVYSILDPTLADPAQFGFATTLLESDGTASDVFGVANASGQFLLSFASDTEDTPSPFGGQGVIFLDEGDGLFDATAYLNPTLQVQGYTATFESDGEAVPESSTYAAIVTLGGLAGWRYLKRRKA